MAYKIVGQKVEKTIKKHKFNKKLREIDQKKVGKDKNEANKKQ